MADMQKYTQADLGGLIRHFERYRKKDGSYIQFSNQSIDLEKTHLNYNLAPNRGSQLAYIKKRLETVDVFKRKDVNYMVTWVVTQPKSLPHIESRKFFEETYKFLVNRYGGVNQKNIISAYVHMDETTPHIHFAFIPIVAKKDGGEKLSAKEAITKKDLMRFHQELSAHLEKALSHPVEILNNKTIGKSIKELQTEAYLEKKIQTESNLEEDLMELNTEYQTLADSLDAFSKTNGQVQKIAGTNSKRMPRITAIQIEQLKVAAMKLPTLDNDFRKAEKKNKRLIDSASELQGEDNLENIVDRLQRLEGAMTRLGLWEDVQREVELVLREALRKHHRRSR